MCIDSGECFTIRGLKVLCPSIFDNTIVHVSVTIISQDYKESELISKAKCIIHLVSIHKYNIQYILIWYLVVICL